MLRRMNAKVLLLLCKRLYWILKNYWLRLFTGDKNIMQVFSDLWAVSLQTDKYIKRLFGAFSLVTYHPRSLQKA